MCSPLDAVRNSPVRAVPGRYALVRCAALPDPSLCFLVAHDPDEITAIVEESRLPELRVLEVQAGYALLEIRVAMQFPTVGFMASAARALAEQGLDLLAVSTYSKDYLLVKAEALTAAQQALAAVGFPCSE
jgi:hypothetical protein